jgi:Trypsin
VIDINGVGAQDYDISRFIAHEDYGFETKEHDIAVIELTRNAHFSLKLRPACLWQSKEINHQSVVATGWGTDGIGRDVLKDLMKVKLDILKIGICEKRFSDEFDIFEEHQICVGVLNGDQPKDTCQGGEYQELLRGVTE